LGKLVSWVKRAREIARHEGVQAVPGAIVRGLRFRLYNVWTRDHPWQGRVVELLGNRWRVDGITVRLDNPAIATRHKSLLLNGAYELPERRLLAKHLPCDIPLVELGGCIGVLSCLANRRLADPDRHLVVEANPNLIPTLERNRDANACRFRVVHAAIAYSTEGTVTFDTGAFTSGFVGEGGSLTVPARTLESLAVEAGFDRFDLICDIEGAERELIHTEGDFLKERVRWLLLEMHPTLLGNEAVTSLNTRLQELGFTLVDSDRTVYCYRNSAQ
jgi:FkbM family methyltransferase